MRLIFAIAVSLAITGATFADTINVPGDHPTIQEAVDASNNGDEIIVAPGRYTSIQDGHVVDMMGKAITLRSSDGPEVTIIDGENARRGIACFSGETESTLIEGFTITNGNSTWYDYDNNGKASDWWENDGGGIICYNNSSPSILNCLIRNSTSNDDGGGLACHLNSNPLVSNCVITGNTAASYDSTGGGIACNSSRPTLTHCLISENTALRNGGGASFVGALGSDAIITHCTISGNYALGDTFGGGGIYCYKSSPTITDCDITENTASLNGGGFFCNDES
ncbi:MAG: right-handed parallel beta-helix repeat-containing protein, partial [Phycisphaerales bacterium]|nr:right-handed parallel beta-helix repeat-containing protein [Phycisphaerales bacterium]